MLLSPVKIFISVLLILTGVNVTAQTSTSSTTDNTSNPLNGRENNPYSKYGIGELVNPNNAVLRGMGNVSSAFENPYEMNTENPASYAFLSRTTFEMGATASVRYIKGSGLNYTTGTASLSYFTIGMPVGKNAGFCIGFKPITHEYYSMADTITSPQSPIGQVARSYSGEGGLNYAYLGGAWQYKGLSIGVNLGYMFGTIQQITSTVPIDTNSFNRAYTADFANYNQIGGLYWKAGIMYERKLDSDYTFRLGGTFALTQNLTDRLNAFQISIYNFGDTIVNDTSVNKGEQHGLLTMPMTYSIGAMLVKNDKWSIGADYSFTQWSGYKSTVDPTLNTGVGSQAYKISLGGEYIPDINNIRNYWSRLTYRWGVYYGTDYLNIDGTQLPNYGITAGISLPFRRSTSHMHMALDLGRLGTTTGSLIQQTYVRYTLGISFNDRWFVKRRYD
jgi:hypothetical protein